VVGKECVPNYGRNPALPAVDGEGVGKQPPAGREGGDGWMKRGFGIGGNGVNALGWAWSENRGGNRKRKRNTTGACSVGVADVRFATSGSDSLSGRVVQCSPDHL
jgi:hypothetical protein